ncbi:MFS transporter [Azospirillum picis]|uniref:MFS family permease n=1 Tax=Azospirillum picis TaxID=488438 RepID=A0ABU0MMY4_9PROT|nr:MFS transporter [Azospirillum picis]MBP2300645.1 MFS family permease [Azospirillum picis]MDQ0534614.1 MFS family permease [Azospirillum picis]
MLSTPLAAVLARRNIHYGWAVVAVTFLSMLVSAGAVGAPGVLLLPLQREFGWDTADISAAMAIRLLLFGLMGPFAAAMINRFGVRRMVLSSLVLVGTGLLSSLAMSQVWQLILLWGFVVGFGTGLTAMVLGATIATRWFAARRGLVIGLLTASSATGQLVFMPLLSVLTEAYGWRSAIALLCAMIGVAAVAMLALMRDHPAELGLTAFGEAEGAAAPRAAGAILPAAFGALRDASATRSFWVLFATFFICGASTNGLIQTHLIPLCVDFAVPEVQAAGLLALMGIFDFIGTVGSGWLSDRFDNRWLLFWYYGLRGLSLIYLPYSDFTLYGLSLFAVFYGLDWIATVPPTVRLIADRFGRERANLVFGWVFAGHQIGAATAAFGAGLSRTVLQSYLPAFFTAGILCLIAALLVPTLGRWRAGEAVARG